MKRTTQLLVLLIVIVLVATVIPVAAIAAPGAKDVKVKDEDSDQILHKAKTHPAGHTKPLTNQKAGQVAGATPTISTVLTAFVSPTFLTRTDTWTVECRLYYSMYQGIDDIEVWWKYPESQEWNYWQTLKTKYYTTESYAWCTFTDRDPAHPVVEYCLIYPGDATYMGSEYRFTVKPGYTESTLFSSNYKPGPGSPTNTYTLYGTVKNSIGGSLSYPVVGLWYREYTSSGWGPWTFWKTVQAGSDGTWRQADYGNALYQYQAQFRGYPLGASNPYWYSDSRVITVDARSGGSIL